MGRIGVILRTIAGLCITGVFVLAATGCSSFDGKKIRAEHAESYPAELAARTEEVLAENQPLNLDACIRIALDNSLTVRSSEIQSRIAKLDRKTAFANFLPAVSLNYQYTNFDPQLVRSISGFEAAMSDKKLHEVTWQIQMSIFNPATWFLYSMHARGAEIAELVTDYAKQMTVLQVTAGYFHCLSLEEYERALDAQMNAAQVLLAEMTAFYDEGLVSDWQVGQVRVLAQSRLLELHRTSRARAEAKAELLVAMGLSPLAEVTLEPQMPLEPAGGSLEDLISEALLNHPNLQIADRKVAIEQEKVKTAISSFLPVLLGFASWTDSSDSYLKYSDYWTAGLASTMTVFNGFANINQYKAARERREESFLEREQASLAVILEVIRAYLALETARDQVALAQSSFDVASKRFIEVRQKWQEGFVGSAEMLEMTAERDRARMQAISSRFQYQVSTATLLNAIGRTKIDYEELHHDGES